MDMTGKAGALSINTPQSLAVPPHACPVEGLFALLGHRWTVLVIWQLNEGALRHRDIVQRLPQISPKILAERLKSLSAAGLVNCTRLSRFPPSVTYELTTFGRGLMVRIKDMELLLLSQSE